jgi:signal peptidase II
LIWSLFICAALVVLDQITKFCAVSFLKPVESVTLAQGILDLTYVENRGMAFGFLQGARWLFVGLTLLILVGIAIYYVRLPRGPKYRKVRFALILISSGAAGNLIDRFRNGFVVDFFHVRFVDFPVFNIADSYVVVGTIFFALIMIFLNWEDEKPVV